MYLRGKIVAKTYPKVWYSCFFKYFRSKIGSFGSKIV